LSGRTDRRNDVIVNHIHRVQLAAHDVARAFTAVVFNHAIPNADDVAWEGYGYDGPVSSEQWNADVLRYRHADLMKRIAALNDDLRHEGLIE
jgi:hypothetical protein